MPYIGSSGAKFHLDGPDAKAGAAARGIEGGRALAMLTVACALLLSLVALVRLGVAASAAVAAVSSALPAASFAATTARRSVNVSVPSGT